MCNYGLKNVFQQPARHADVGAAAAVLRRSSWCRCAQGVLLPARRRAKAGRLGGPAGVHESSGRAFLYRLKTRCDVELCGEDDFRLPAQPRLRGVQKRLFYLAFGGRLGVGCLWVSGEEICFPFSVFLL